jgi:hypothetical protein
VTDSSGNVTLRKNMFGDQKGIDNNNNNYFKEGDKMRTGSGGVDGNKETHFTLDGYLLANGINPVRDDDDDEEDERPGGYENGWDKNTVESKLNKWKKKKNDWRGREQKLMKNISELLAKVWSCCCFVIISFKRMYQRRKKKFFFFLIFRFQNMIEYQKS